VFFHRFTFEPFSRRDLQCMHVSYSSHVRIEPTTLAQVPSSTHWATRDRPSIQVLTNMLMIHSLIMLFEEFYFIPFIRCLELCRLRRAFLLFSVYLTSHYFRVAHRLPGPTTRVLAPGSEGKLRGASNSNRRSQSFNHHDMPKSSSSDRGELPYMRK
jgi:hypothetical protein